MPIGKTKRLKNKIGTSSQDDFYPDSTEAIRTIGKGLTVPLLRHSG